MLKFEDAHTKVTPYYSIAVSRQDDTYLGCICLPSLEARKYKFLGSGRDMNITKSEMLEMKEKIKCLTI